MFFNAFTALRKPNLSAHGDGINEILYNYSISLDGIGDSRTVFDLVQYRAGHKFYYAYGTICYGCQLEADVNNLTTLCTQHQFRLGKKLKCAVCQTPIRRKSQ